MFDYALTAIGVAAIALAAGCSAHDSRPTVGTAPERPEDAFSDTPERLREACARGSSFACTELGISHQRAEPPNHRAARAAFRQACAGAHREGCLQYGYLATTGIGGKRDPRAARKAYLDACVLKDSQGCFEYGRLHTKQGGARLPDHLTARTSFRKACHLGHEHSCQLTYSYLVSETQDPRALARARELARWACKRGQKSMCAKLPVEEQDEISKVPRRLSRSTITAVTPGVSGTIVECAREPRYTGDVRVSIKVKASGDVERVTVGDGPPVFRDCVAAELQRLKFPPARRGLVINRTYYGTKRAEDT